MRTNPDEDFPPAARLGQIGRIGSDADEWFNPRGSVPFAIAAELYSGSRRHTSAREEKGSIR